MMMTQFQSKSGHSMIVKSSFALLSVAFFLFQSCNAFLSAGWQNRYGQFPATSVASPHMIDGLAENFDTLCEIDDTLQALKEQLPLTLTKPLNAVSASKVYAKDVRLTVVIPANEDATDDDNASGDNDITLIQTREELVSLTDVLVVAMSAARQANTVLGGDKATEPSQVNCQLFIDDSLKAIRIAWKTSVPIVGRIGSNDNRVEGVSELIFDESSGKVQTHRILDVAWNGQPVNGPAIGRALRAIQSASSNAQQSPLLQGLFANSAEPKLFSDLRDGLLEQVATSLSSSMPTTETVSTPIVYSVPSLKGAKGWLDTNTSIVTQEPIIPFPGSEEWKEYALVHSCLVHFYEDVIPRLSKDGTVSPSDFATNVTLTGTDGAILVQGKNSVSDFYQSTALARRSTGGSWTLKRCSLVDWKTRAIAIEYEATNSIPPCSITGRDIYTLMVMESRPVVRQINQTKLSVVTSDGSLSLDNRWLMKNLVTAVESGRLATGSSARDVFSDLLLQQLNRVVPADSPRLGSKKPKLSETAAATVYYIMSDLHENSKTLLNDTSSTLPPAAEYMTDDLELHGYLGETLLRGRNVYSRAVSSFLTNVQQSIAQKRLVVEKTKPPRVELLPNGDVRLSQIFFFRLPPPGASLFLPDSSVTGVPLKFELVSDYKINAETGQIYQHRLIETRINGQLTPADVLSRTVQGFLNPQDRSSRLDGERDSFVSDTLRWFQKISEFGR